MEKKGRSRLRSRWIDGVKEIYNGDDKRRVTAQVQDNWQRLVASVKDSGCLLHLDK